MTNQLVKMAYQFVQLRLRFGRWELVSFGLNVKYSCIHHLFLDIVNDLYIGKQQK